MVDRATPTNGTDPLVCGRPTFSQLVWEPSNLVSRLGLIPSVLHGNGQPPAQPGHYSPTTPTHESCRLLRQTQSVEKSQGAGTTYAGGWLLATLLPSLLTFVPLQSLSKTCVHSLRSHSLVSALFEQTTCLKLVVHIRSRRHLIPPALNSDACSKLP